MLEIATYCELEHDLGRRIYRVNPDPTTDHIARTDSQSLSRVREKVLMGS